MELKCIIQNFSIFKINKETKMAICNDQIPPRFNCGGIIEPNLELKHAIYATHKMREHQTGLLRLQEFMMVGRVYFPNNQIEERLCLKNTHQN